MDLTRKCKSWAGNVCHQFGSIYQDGDDFMRKGTMSFVENQVQSVGTRVKRLYSDVVRDVHPPSDDDDDDDYQGITIVSEKQLSENQGPVCDFRYSDASLADVVETDELFSGALDEVCKSIHHKKTLSRDIVFEGPNSDESGSRPNTTISTADEMGSPDCDVAARRGSGIDWTLCDVSSEVEYDDETGTLDVLPGLDGSDSEKHDTEFLSEIEMTPSETDTDVMHLDMETVDISPDMKHDETSIILNGNFVRAACGGKRNFRYYKKLMKDAITHRKRLSKEYEHLSILYGDIESETSNHFVPISEPSTTNLSVQAVRSPSTNEMSETEWELV